MEPGVKLVIEEGVFSQKSKLRLKVCQENRNYLQYKFRGQGHEGEGVFNEKSKVRLKVCKKDKEKTSSMEPDGDGEFSKKSKVRLIFTSSRLCQSYR